MYDGQWTAESIIEGASFATQTITTVGYGNWETPAIPRDQPDRPVRVLKMRGLSILYMILGASWFTYAFGFIVGVSLAPKR